MEFQTGNGIEFGNACWVCDQPNRPDGVFCDCHGPEDVMVSCSVCGAKLGFDEISARYSDTGRFICIDCYD
jgi:hypothetical protein